MKISFIRHKSVSDEIIPPIHLGYLPLDRIGISYFQPYPGTKEYIELEKKASTALHLGQSKLSLHTISYTPENITAKELKRLRLKGFVLFYFRPKILIKLLKEIKSLQHLFFILKRGIRWLTT